MATFYPRSVRASQENVMGGDRGRKGETGMGGLTGRCDVLEEVR